MFSAKPKTERVLLYSKFFRLGFDLGFVYFFNYNFLHLVLKTLSAVDQNPPGIFVPL